MEWNLPDYREQSDSVRARMIKLNSRPVILDVKNLSKDFLTKTHRETVLKNISFQVHHREFLTIIGVASRDHFLAFLALLSHNSCARGARIPRTA